MIFSDLYKVLAPAEKIIICETERDEHGNIYVYNKCEGYIESIPLEYMNRIIVQINTLNFSNAITVILD